MFTNSAFNGEVITPSDTENIEIQGLWLQEASTVKLTFLKLDKTAGNTVTMVLASGYHPLRIKKIFSTGSTIASGIIGLKI